MATNEQPDPADASDAITAQIEALIAPGLEANRWRADFHSFRHKRLWEERFKLKKVKQLRQLTGEPAGKRILDLGCGKGGLTVALGQQGSAAVGCDLRPRNCRVTNLRGRRYGLEERAVCAVGEELPFRSHSFDIVLAIELIEHVQHPGRLLGEIHRVLRPGGCAWVTVPNSFCHRDPHYHIWFMWLLPAPLQRRVTRLLGRDKRSSSDRQELSDMHYFSYGKFVSLAGLCGFETDDAHMRRLARSLAKPAASPARRLRLKSRLLLGRLARRFSFWTETYGFVLHKRSAP